VGFRCSKGHENNNPFTTGISGGAKTKKDTLSKFSLTACSEKMSGKQNQSGFSNTMTKFSGGELKRHTIKWYTGLLFSEKREESAGNKIQPIYLLANHIGCKSSDPLEIFYCGYFDIWRILLESIWPGASSNSSLFQFSVDLSPMKIFSGFWMHTEQAHYWFPAECETHWKCMTCNDFSASWTVPDKTFRHGKG
jgi:hypothetical protein